MYTTEIREGDYVRSYDFVGVDNCFIEGVVQAVGVINGDVNVPGSCYAVLCERVVWDGKEEPLSSLSDTFPGPYVLWPPLNGLKKSTGGVTARVVKMVDRDSLVA